MEEIKKNKDKVDSNLEEVEKEFLDPTIGKAYEGFVSQKNTPGTSSFVLHQLMSDFEDKEFKNAQDLIAKTLMPADIITYVLERSREDPLVFKALREEIKKRRLENEDV